MHLSSANDHDDDQDDVSDDNDNNNDNNNDNDDDDVSNDNNDGDDEDYQDNGVSVRCKYGGVNPYEWVLDIGLKRDSALRE